MMSFVLDTDVTLLILPTVKQNDNMMALCTFLEAENNKISPHNISVQTVK